MRNQGILDGGKGVSGGPGCDPRDTESGQLLIDRARHLDVLEYLLWINRWGRGADLCRIYVGSMSDLKHIYGWCAGIPVLDQQVGGRGGRGGG